MPDKGYWVTQEKKICVQTFGDLVFVLDSSTSIGPEKWADVLTFVDDVVQRVNNRSSKSKGGVQVGVVVYNNFAKVAIPLGAEKDPKKLRERIKAIKFTEGVTNTGEDNRSNALFSLSLGIISGSFGKNDKLRLFLRKQ